MFHLLNTYTPSTFDILNYFISIIVYYYTCIYMYMYVLCTLYSSLKYYIMYNICDCVFYDYYVQCM